MTCVPSVRDTAHAGGAREITDIDMRDSRHVACVTQCARRMSCDKLYAARVESTPGLLVIITVSNVDTLCTSAHEYVHATCVAIDAV